jgi:hypothetical protein
MMSSMNQCVQSGRNLGLKERIMKRANDGLGRGNDGLGIANAGAQRHSALESQTAKRPCLDESFGNERQPDRTNTKKPPVTIQGDIHGVFDSKHPLPSVPQSDYWTRDLTLEFLFRFPARRRGTRGVGRFPAPLDWPGASCIARVRGDYERIGTHPVGANEPVVRVDDDASSLGPVTPFFGPGSKESHARPWSSPRCRVPWATSVFATVASSWWEKCASLRLAASTACVLWLYALC